MFSLPLFPNYSVYFKPNYVLKVAEMYFIFPNYSVYFKPNYVLKVAEMYFIFPNYSVYFKPVTTFVPVKLALAYFQTIQSILNG